MSKNKPTSKNIQLLINRLTECYNHLNSSPMTTPDEDSLIERVATTLEEFGVKID